MHSVKPETSPHYRIAAVLNTASGSCVPENATEMETIFREAGIEPVRIWSGGSEELDTMLTEAEASEADVIVVLGGDGTIRTAASRCTSTSAILLPLPGGTMNMMPKALYGNGSWQDILRATLVHPSVKSISGGEVAGHRFFITAICGAPALWARVREAVRDVDVSKALEQGKIALDHMFSAKIQYHFNEMNEGTAEALLITCPLIATTLDEDRKVFEAAVVDVNDAGEIFELATNAAFGSWQESKSVSVVRTAHIEVSSNHHIPLILDGESIHIEHTATFEFVPNAFRVLIPVHEVLS